MPEKTSAQGYGGDGILEDIGMVRILRVLAEAPNGRSERVVRDFMEHPKRDTLLSALALSGLGFAVGATIASRRRP